MENQLPPTTRLAHYTSPLTIASVKTAKRRRQYVKRSLVVGSFLPPCSRGLVAAYRQPVNHMIAQNAKNLLVFFIEHVVVGVDHHDLTPCQVRSQVQPRASSGRVCHRRGGIRPRWRGSKLLLKQCVCNNNVVYTATALLCQKKMKNLSTR